MSRFDIEESLRRAKRRLGPRTGMPRKPRSDRGRSRLHPRVYRIATEELSGLERPPIREIIARLNERCREAGLRAPSRATLYRLMDRIPVPTYGVGDLPEPVRAALYNLDASSRVPGHQLAFYCVNYGDLSAVSFAAGLPWLAIHQALRMPGYRKKSHGLLEAIAKARRI